MTCERWGSTRPMIWPVTNPSQTVGLGKQQQAYDLAICLTASYNWECRLIVRATIRNSPRAVKTASHLVAVEIVFCHSFAARLRRKVARHLTIRSCSSL